VRRQRVNEINCVVFKPHVENSLPDCAIVWGMITINTGCKLSSQLYCMQTHALLVQRMYTNSCLAIRKKRHL
jgi:hypothetical protein